VAEEIPPCLYLGYLFPNRLRVKLPYYDSDNKNVNAVANGSCNWTYRANGMFDPLLAGPVGSTGHQPMGFDQLASIYHGYTVKGCKLSIQLLAGSTLHRQVLCRYLYIRIPKPLLCGLL